MDTPEWVETVDIDERRFIQLEFGRRWPKYEVVWYVRERAGDADYPRANGVVDGLLPSGGNLDALWDELREKAVAQATESAGSAASAPSEPSGTSFLGRLFGRR